MLYLVIFVLVAALGLLRLWLQHRRERIRLGDAGGIRSTLERLSSQPALRGAPPEPASSMPARPVPLEPARRVAAKRRIAARRQARRTGAAR